MADEDGPQSVEHDSRGILDPLLLRERVQLTRYPATGELVGLVEWFWAVRWSLPNGMRHRQDVLTHPGANLSIGHLDAEDGRYRPGLIEARCHGVATRLSTRVLAGTGWTVAAMTLPGGLGAFTSAPMDTTDRNMPLSQTLSIDADLADQVAAVDHEGKRVQLLSDALAEAIEPERAEQARQVSRVARIMETDRTVRTIGELAERTSIAQRTLQRRFHDYAGVSPTWVLRRYRLLDTAEAVRNGERPDWAGLAADLGYADQAHLVRDFRAAIGRTPSAYARAQSDHGAD